VPKRASKSGSADSKAILVGIISDTHGLLRPEALEALKGVDQILHAGDVGKPEILDQLRNLAPTIAVRGNADHGEWAAKLAEAEVITVGGLTFYMLHDLQRLDLDPEASGFHIVVSGHSHKPVIEQANEVLYLNPGAAGPRRFGLPITVARLRIANMEVEAEIKELKTAD
jgi:putative phosphoesterase